MGPPAESCLKNCDICGRIFSVKSNLICHMKVHATPIFKCSDKNCDKVFSLKQHLDRHKKQHLYPDIQLFKQNEVGLGDTLAKWLEVDI